MDFIILGATAGGGAVWAELCKNHGPFAAGAVFGALTTLSAVAALMWTFFKKTSGSEWKELLEAQRSENKSLRARINRLEKQLEKSRKETKR